MAGLISTGTLLALVLALGCTDKSDPNFGGSGGGDGGSTDGGTDDSGDGGETGDGGDGGDGGEEDAYFDEPGDVVEFLDEDGEAVVDLSDFSGDSNQDQEFYLVLVRPDSGEIGYQLRYDDIGGSDTGARFPDAPSTGRSATRPGPRQLATSSWRKDLRSSIRAGDIKPVAAALPPPPYDETDIGTARREFRVRNSLVDELSYSASSATLWAIGDTVAIWVDDTVAIDWDIDCDGTVDVEASRDAYGFDNCDLQTIADIVDTNIIPNIRSLFGDESDVNGDDLVSVVITPELNVISYTSDDEDVQGALVGSYADPEVDLNDWHADRNPVSDEQEVIYVFAPDPYGFYNPAATASVDEYTSMELAAQIARSFFFLVSYNQKVLVAEGEPEEAWVNQALGALAADLTGFGAVYFDDAWDYLDAPHLNPLVLDDDSGSLSTDSLGAQYLFARWLYDSQGEKILASIVQVEGVGGGSDTGASTATTGADNIANVVGTTFEDLVVRWHVALLTSGVTNSDGEVLVDPDQFAQYADAQNLTAPTSSPAPGDFYGANGYQSGVDLRGTNRYMEGGTTDRPVENANNRVLMSGTDHSTYVTGNDFWGYVEGDYAVQVVRLTEITFDAARLRIQSSDSGFVGAVVRWNDRDPLASDIAVERIFSPTAVDNIELPVLPSDGGTIYGVGQISEAGFTSVIAADGTSTLGAVPDTDRWLLSMDEFTDGDSVNVSVHLTRQYTNESGDAGPFDPWISVVPVAYVPTPTVSGTRRGSCTEGPDFQYPTSMLEYLYYQLFTSSLDGSGDFDEPTLEDPFTCGEESLVTTCGEDWDRDGILDINELQPASFTEQVNAMQCTLYGNDTGLFTVLTPDDLIDVDTLDENEWSYFDRAQNVGGMAHNSGEEAYIEVELEGGEDYLVIVGAYDYEGTYELEIKQVD